MNDENRADSPQLDSDEKELIKQLRTEVFQLKDCISKYTIQALVFVAAAVGIILKFQADNFSDRTQDAFRLLLGGASLFLLFPLRAVSRTAIHKLGTINRNLGYELHLQRSRSLISRHGGWRNKYRKIGWEEAMRAWRIVQATLYAALCKNSAGTYRDDANPKSTTKNAERYYWYDVSTLVHHAGEADLEERASWYKPRARLRRRTLRFANGAPEYHPGNYVKKMTSIIHRSMAACLSPLLIAVLGSFYSDGAIRSSARDLLRSTRIKNINIEWTPIHIILLLTLAVAFAYMVAIWREDNIRLRQLESGILSIHSCAIVWRAVVVAHYRAIDDQQEVRNKENPRVGARNGYTFLLAQRAMSLARNRFEIHAWTDGMHPDRLPIRTEQDSAVDNADADNDTQKPLAPKTFSVEIDGRQIGVLEDVSLDGRGLGVRLSDAGDAVATVFPRKQVATIAGEYTTALEFRHQTKVGETTIRGFFARTLEARATLLQVAKDVFASNNSVSGTPAPSSVDRRR